MTELKPAYIAKELAPLLSLSVKNVLARAARESWASRPRKGRGGGSEWLTASMPDATRLALTAQMCAPVQCELPGLSMPDTDSSALPPTAAERAGARAAALQFFASWRVGRSKAPRTLAHEFAALWNAGQIPAPDWARAALPRFSGNSLINWLDKVSTSGTAALAGNYGSRAGSGAFAVESEAYDVVQGILFEYPHIKAPRLLEMLRVRLGASIALPSVRRTQAWLKEWKEGNRSYYQYILNPDAWRSRYMLAMGSMSAHITRMNQRWEMDSTKVDLITSDGTRHNITAVIDVHTRDAWMYVSRTSSSHAVASTLRRGLITWGKPETVGTDNGADYIASHIMRVMVDLTIEQQLCPPFQPWKKPFVEQFFHTFLHDLLELMPGYCGHNVAERQALRERESFASRLMRGGAKGKAEADAVIVNMTPEELQAWIDQWLLRYRHRPHSGLKGKTPFEAVQAARRSQTLLEVADSPALHILLLPLADGQAGWRTVGKEGVRAGLPGHYQASALAAHVGQRVQVRIDDTDLGTAYIFDEDGRFVCRALNTTMHGHSREVAVEAKRQQRAELAARRKAGASAARRHSVADLPLEVLMADVARAQQIEFQPAAGFASQGKAVLAAPALLEAHRAARAKASAPTLSEAEQDALRAKAAEALAEAPFEQPGTSAARFDLYLQTRAAQARGEDMPVRQARWANYYGQSSECAGHKLLHEMMHGTPESVAAHG